jgi:hypothetical protein
MISGSLEMSKQTVIVDGQARTVQLCDAPDFIDKTN